MEHNLTSTEGDTNIRSIRVEVVLEMRVGSVTVWVRLNDDTIDNNL